MYIKCLFASFLLLSCLSLFKSEGSCPQKKKECVSSATFCHIYGTEGTGKFDTFYDYYRTCSKGEICKIPVSSKIGQCVKRISLISEGQDCNVSSECQSGVCKDSKCVYVADNESCDFDSNCGRESFCDIKTKKCLPLKKETEECELDKECQVGLACGKTTGNKQTCVKMFSLEAGAQSNNELLCKDGYIVSIGNIYYCAKASLENYECNISETNQCKLTINAGAQTVGKDVYGTCRCNWNGKAYCEPVSNSESWTNFYQAFSKHISEVNKNSIHSSTMRDDWWGVGSIKKAWIDYKEFFNLNEAAPCVKEFYYRQADIDEQAGKGEYIKMAFMSALLSLVILF